ncbi:hypothetical protein N8I77_006919 [Diaporthe amygdali]|uniref:WSC domain-containing protein n=1 Tax=Phomopsis amygdali TaxID=1214568 RepID=A0AAD9W4F3_PHOAM|nr:hypothetical protein N8I77_006919 [Diaporthe amygdali]
MGPNYVEMGFLVVLLSSGFPPALADTTGTGTVTITGTTGTASGTTMPGTTASGTTMPGTTASGTTMPGTTVSGTTVVSSPPSGTTPTSGPTSISSTPGSSGTVAPTATSTSSSSSSTSTRSTLTTSSSRKSVLVVTATATVTKTHYSTRSANCGAPSPFPPALPLGCYSEGPDGRALPDFFLEDDVRMTIDKCANLCMNYTFLGLEYGSQCWCSNSIQNGAFPVDDGQCSMVCTGNAQQICGSEKSLSVYLPPPPPPPRPVNNITFKAAGCYAEPADGTRAMDRSRTATDQMTPAACFNICGLSGWPYAGLEYGDECWCDDDVSTEAMLTDPSRCNMKCSGDGTQICGGDRVFNMYNGTFNYNTAASLPRPHAAFWDRLLNGRV